VATESTRSYRSLKEKAVRDLHGLWQRNVPKEGVYSRGKSDQRSATIQVGKEETKKDD
jgi:hypothetical protein